jgi:hypothetical protein
MPSDARITSESLEIGQRSNMLLPERKRKVNSFGVIFPWESFLVGRYSSCDIKLMIASARINYSQFH